MSSAPSPLHPPESVRRFTSVKVGILLLFLLLLTLFGLHEGGDGEGHTPSSAQQERAQAAHTHTEAVAFPAAGLPSAADKAGRGPAAAGDGPATGARAERAGLAPGRDFQRSSVGEGITAGESMTDLAAREAARPGARNGEAATAAATRDAVGPVLPAGESLMATGQDASAPAPARGNAMIELPGPLSFVFVQDPTRGIRLSGTVPDDDTRNQWMNAIRLGARGAPVDGALRLGHVDGHAAARWEPQLIALVALMRERNISELRVRGDVVEVVSGKGTPAQAQETLALIRAQVPSGYRVQPGGAAAQPGAALPVAGSGGTPAGSGGARASGSGARSAPAGNGRWLADAPTARGRHRGRENDRSNRTAARDIAQKSAGNCPVSLKRLASPVFFVSGSANLSLAESRRLQRLGSCLGRTARVRVTGHADPRYAAAYNKTLSERRARAVAAAIREGGFSSARITIIGAGQVRERTHVDKAILQRARRVDISLG